jgi:hypothetical protein
MTMISTEVYNLILATYLLHLFTTFLSHMTGKAQMTTSIMPSSFCVHSCLPTGRREKPTYYTNCFK